MPGNIDLTFRVAGADAVASSLQQIENRARGMASSMVSSTGNARSAVRALESAMAAASTVARIAGVAQGEFASKLTDVTLAVSSAAFAVQALRGITLSWAAVTAAATAAAAQFSAALAILSGPVGLIILGVAALTTGVILLIRHFQSLRAATDDAANSAATMATAARGLRDANLILAGSLAQVSLAFTDYGIHLNAAGAGLEGFARQLRGMEFQDTLTGLDQLIARKEALGGTIVNTSARLGFLIGVQREYLQTLQLIAQRSGLTRDQQQALTAKIEAAKNSLVSLNGELGKESRALQDSAASAAADLDVTITLIERKKALEEAEARTARFVQESNEQQARFTELLGRMRDEAMRNVAAFDRWIAQANQIAETGLTGELNNWINAANAFGIQLDASVIAGLQRTAAVAASAREALAVMRQTLQNLQDTEDAMAAALKGENDALTENREALGARVGALDRELSLITDRPKQLEREQAGLREIIAAYREHIAQIQQAINARIAEGGQTDALKAALDGLNRALAGLENRGAQTANAIRDQMLQPLKDLAQRVKDDFEQAFGDILFRARDFSDVLQSILETIGRSMIRDLFQNFDLSKFLGFPQAGMISILGAQGGALISRPTLAMIGEGGQSEAVVPLPDNRSIPVRFTGEGRQAQRPQEIVVKVINVFDRSQIPATQPDEIVAVIANDMMRGGPTEHVVRKIIGGR